MSFFKANTDKFKDILKQETFKKYKLVFCIILVLCLVLEIFICNFRSVEALFNREITNFSYTVSNAVRTSDRVYTLAGRTAQRKNDNEYKISVSSVSRNSDGTYNVVSADKKETIVATSADKNSDGTYTISDSRAYIEITGINQKVKNIKLDITRTEDEGYTDIRLWAIDEANQTGIYAPKREITDEWHPSEYIRTHFSGDIERLRIYITGLPGEKITINDLRLNCRVPVYFSVSRFLFMLCALMALYILRPKSFIYKHKVDFRKRWQLYTVIGLLIAEIALLWSLCNINPSFISPNWSSHRQYQELADSLLNGHTYLINKQPSEELLAMENPYDTQLRAKLGVDFEWDHAYRNGHYYVYFGIVPELVFYLPYRAITGLNFPNYIGVFISCALICAGVIFLLYRLSRKWFENTPFGIFLIASILMMNTCGTLYMAKRPDFYSIPVAMAMMFAIFGLAFWLCAERRTEDGAVQLKSRYLTLGAICMALVAGCRPHVLLTTFFGVILFWRAVFKDRTLFSKKSVKQTIAICAPYIIIAAGIMIYNYVRFKSPFDFGANYNLTTNDMTQRGIVMDRNLTGLFYYLFQPLTFRNEFPYIQTTYVNSLYQGLTLSEGMSGGVIWASPIIFFGIRGMVKRKWYENDMRSYIISCSAIVMGAVIAMLDAQLAGILTRYYSDFSWILLLGAVIAVFAEYNFVKCDNEKQRLVSILLICLVVSTVVFGLNIFNDVDNSVIHNNPALYYKMKYLIGFLL